MRASLNLLRRYVDLEGISTDEIVRKLTYSGLEVEQVIAQAEATNLVIGQILSCQAHPSSDHLHVLQVDLGMKYGTEQIVCGAPNAREGLKVIVARVGARLGKEGHTISSSKIRGVESNGMCCALPELGVDPYFLSQKQLDGIEELPEDAEVGNENVLAYLGLDDTILEINVLANRSDCLAAFSLAKELGALFHRPVHLPELPSRAELPSPVSVASLTENCPQFSIKLVEGATMKESPKWLKSCLMSYGIRAINNIVDIGNYVMLLTGQPLHMYDMDKLPGTSFEVIDSFSGEFTALDGKSYGIVPGDILIRNGGRIGCLGGIMGAAECAVGPTTTRIAVEAANFNGACVRRTTVRTGLSSDSSARFIKGINPHQDEFVLNLAAELLVRLADARTVYQTVRCSSLSDEIAPIACSDGYINRRLGTSFTSEEIDAVLLSLGIEVRRLDSGRFEATPPAHRIDLKCGADLSEEVIRFIGLDTIRPTLPEMVTTVGEYTPVQRKKNAIREHLIARGLHEILTYTLLSPEADQRFVFLNQDEAIRLLNPMTVEHSIVRRGLVSSALETVKYNLSRQIRDIAVFEISDITTERQRYEELAVVLNGNRKVRGSFETKPYDFYDIFGIFESVCALLGIESNRYRVARLSDNEYFHPGRSVGIFFGKQRVGVCGELHPGYSEDLGRTYVLDLNLSRFLELKRSPTKMQPISKYPAVERDYALVIREEIPSSDVIRIVKREAHGIVSDVSVFDQYSGEFLPAGTKSLAIQIRYCSLDHTLTDAEINPVESGILSSLNQQLGAYLRS